MTTPSIPINEVALLPCPFCGHEKPMTIFDEAAHRAAANKWAVTSQWHLIRCQYCYAIIERWTLEEAIKAWNTRAALLMGDARKGIVGRIPDADDSSAATPSSATPTPPSSLVEALEAVVNSQPGYWLKAKDALETWNKSAKSEALPLVEALTKVKNSLRIISGRCWPECQKHVENSINILDNIVKGKQI